MPKVRASSGMMGTMRRPICSSRSSWRSSRTNAMVVDTSRPVPVPVLNSSYRSAGGSLRGLLRTTRLGRQPPSAARRSIMYWISRLFGPGMVIGRVLQLPVGDRQLQAVRGSPCS